MLGHNFHHIGDHDQVHGHESIVICVYNLGAGKEIVYYDTGDVLISQLRTVWGARTETLCIWKG